MSDQPQQKTWHAWVKVDEGRTNAETTWRMRVPTGWLYRWKDTVTFVPDRPPSAGT